MAEVMLMPFTKTSLNENDCILNYARAYYNVTEKSLNGNSIIHKKNKSDFEEAKWSFIRIFDSDYRWEHHDDIIMNINMFYPGYKLKEYLEPPNDIGKFYVQYILDISRTFITFRDGDIAIRYWSKDDDPLLNNYNEYEKIDLWNNISRTCNTDLFIAATYINFNVGINNIYDAPNIISMADKDIRKRDCRNTSAY